MDVSHDSPRPESTHDQAPVIVDLKKDSSGRFRLPGSRRHAETNAEGEQNSPPLCVPLSDASIAYGFTATALNLLWASNAGVLQMPLNETVQFAGRLVTVNLGAACLVGGVLGSLAVIRSINNSSPTE